MAEQPCGKEGSIVTFKFRKTPDSIWQEDHVCVGEKCACSIKNFDDPDEIRIPIKASEASRLVILAYNEANQR